MAKREKTKSQLRAELAQLHARLAALEAEAALREGIDFSERIMNSMLDGLSVVDVDGTYLAVNDAFCQITGFAREELLGTRPPYLYWPPEHRDAIHAVFEEMRTGEPRNLEFVFMRKSGERFPVVLAPAVVRDATGNAVRYIATIKDITDRKRAEAALREANATLEQRVNERTAELAASNELLRKEREALKHLLQASDRERQLIAYDVHDGLAQHLAAALMQFESFDALKNDCPRQAETAHAVGIEMVRQAHAEARRLISGVRPPILDESGVIAAIDHLVHDPRTCPDQTIDWQADLKTHRLAPIVENALFRMMQEALGNARLHSRSKSVKVSLAEKDNVLELVVEDRGVGFDPDTVSDECFGLRSIRERARLLGGTLSIRSAPGRGTCLRVTLPAAGEAEA